MYHGEVNVAQEELNSFLAVAEELRVKGLTQNNQQSSIPSKPKQSYSVPKSPPPQKTRPPDREPLPQPKRPKPAPTQSYAADDDEIQEVVPVKSEPHEIQSSAVNLYQQHQPAPVQHESLHYAGDESYDDYGGYEADHGYEGVGGVVDQSMAAVDGNKGTEFLNKYINRVDGPGGAQFQCTVCGKNHGQRPHAQNHVESKHFPEMFVYNCQFCNLTFNGRNKFYVHNSKFH